jgi:hypothetical protein
MGVAYVMVLECQAFKYVTTEMIFLSRSSKAATVLSRIFKVIIVLSKTSRK